MKNVLRITYLLTALLLLLQVIPLRASALPLSQEESDAIYGDHTIYQDVVGCGATGTCSCSGGATNLTGSDNKSKIYNFLTGKGFTPFQVAGIMGNMEGESNSDFETRLVEYGFPNGRGEISKAGQPSSLSDTVPPDANAKHQPGYGLVGWTAQVYKDGLNKLSAERGVPAGDLALQLDYLWTVLTSGADGVKAGFADRMKATTDVKAATVLFETDFEKHAPPLPDPIRLKFAEDLLVELGSGSGAVASSNVACGASGAGGQVVGDFSLPVDRKIYDEHKEYFTKPHHDYPAADIPVPIGTPVYSMTGGKVLKAPTNGDCGVGVIIDAGNNVNFIYCHGSDGGSIDGAKQGDTVKPGQLIMHSATTGSSTGPHLHVGITISSKNYCPQNLFVGIAEGNIPALSSLPTSGCTN
ncbi:MAG: phage tail tip lysozyme [Candidatus Saccharibacteria bacterium]